MASQQQTHKGARKNFWSHDRSLSILLVILLIHMFIVIPLGVGGTRGEFFFFIFYVILLVAGVRYLAAHGWVRILAISVLMVMMLLGYWLKQRYLGLSLLRDVSAIVYWTFMAGIVIARTFDEGPVTLHRIQGAVVGYLIIGLIFSEAYHLVFTLLGPESFTIVMGGTTGEFNYFSITTLTTLGYGDVLPKAPAARSLANLEALTGQLYPVIFIARLVSMEYEWSRRKDSDTKTDAQ